MKFRGGSATTKDFKQLDKIKYRYKQEKKY